MRRSLGKQCRFYYALQNYALVGNSPDLLIFLIADNEAPPTRHDKAMLAKLLDGGRVKVQISKKPKRFAHVGPIALQRRSQRGRPKKFAVHPPMTIAECVEHIERYKDASPLVKFLNSRRRLTSQDRMRLAAIFEGESPLARVCLPIGRPMLHEDEEPLKLSARELADLDVDRRMTALRKKGVRHAVRKAREEAAAAMKLPVEAIENFRRRSNRVKRPDFIALKSIN